MSNTTVEIKPVAKNDVTLNPTVVKAKRGAFKGQEFPAVQLSDKEEEAVLKENIWSWFKFRGVKRGVKLINAYEAAEGQTALEHASDYESSEMVNPETGKKTEIKVVQSVDSNKYWETYLSDTLRGGETIADMEEDQENLKQEFMQAWTKTQDKTLSDNEKTALTARMFEIQAEIQDLDKAIQERRRPDVAARRRKVATA